MTKNISAEFFSCDLMLKIHGFNFKIENFLNDNLSENFTIYVKFVIKLYVLTDILLLINKKLNSSFTNIQFLKNFPFSVADKS